MKSPSLDRTAAFAAIALALGVVLTSRANTPADTFTPITDSHLHNAHRVTEKVFSGAQPQGEEGFAALRELGVKTIISVDGAKPDVATAKKYGMRYVHLPIGYDSVEPDEGKAIAKAIDEMPGPIYIHCHHGKHRSAAAVAVACVYNGSLPPAKAQAVLETFGTGSNYTGLWQAARDARALESSELRSLQVDFVESASVGDLVESMVKIDQHWEHLKQIQKSGWRPPADHPDLDAAHEALMVQEQLHEAARLHSDDRPANFLALLGRSESATSKLREILLADSIDAKSADRSFKLASESCTACHKSFRD